MESATKACPICGERIKVAARKCRFCGEYLDPSLKPASTSIEDDPNIRMLLPVGRSGWAIAAGYLGLFAVLPVFGVVAIIVGILAIMHLRRRPDLHGWGRAIFGLAMGGLFTILYGTMFLIAVLSR